MSRNNALLSDLHEIKTAGGALWSELRDARILVTGATGFFGRWLLESFSHINRECELGAFLVAVSRDPAKFKASAPHLAHDNFISFHRSDVRNFIPPQGNFTHIIHAATESCGAQKHHDAMHMVDTIISGTRHLLDFARTQNKPRFLYISSGAIYGAARVEVMNETDTTAPRLSDGNLEYSESKRMAETLCMLAHREWNLPVTIARGFSFIGPHFPLDEHFAIGNFIRDALAEKPIDIKGDGTAIRSYLYASDLTRWLWTILLRGTPGEAYNVGSDQAITIRQVAEQVKRIIAPKIDIHIAGKANRRAPKIAQVPGIQKAKKELQLIPHISLDEAIRRTAEWYRITGQTTAKLAPESNLKNIQAIIFDFDGVMTDNRVAVMQNGEEAVFCNRSDGLGIEMLRKQNIPMLILSKEKNPVVGMRAKKLGIECLQGIDDKPVALAAWLKEHGFDVEQTVYLGNDINDLGCMQMVGWPIAVADSYPPVKNIARILLHKNGGHGAVRELADMMVIAKNA